MSTLHVDPYDIEGAEQAITPGAWEFVADLHRRFAARRDELLDARDDRYRHILGAGALDFLSETSHVREGDWTVAAAPDDLIDRRVEITGPTDRKMAINALNSGANVWLADLEDANTPHWRNVIDGQVTLYRAIRRTLQHTAPDGGRRYLLSRDARLATIVVRPRGWHLDERHVTVDGRPGVGALVDFGLYFYGNAAQLLATGSGPYFYLPKTESHHEARLWADIFAFAEQRLDIERGSVRATVLIETITAAFEMDEILYELRDYASGLNAGRWDYLFSIIKKFRECGDRYVLPDRASVTMLAPFMRAYTELLVQTCHKRGAFAIGGMAAFIPSRRDAAVNDIALAKVREDKSREARDGFDGSWVAHPDLVSVCRAVFDDALGNKPNQLDRQRPDVDVTARDLLDIAATGGTVTEAGVRGNVEVALRYLASWLDGNGAVAIHNLMEDAATVEISRSQLWQWIRNAVVLDDGRTVTADLVRTILDEEFSAIISSGGSWADGNPDKARKIFADVALADDYVDFLTTAASAEID